MIEILQGNCFDLMPTLPNVDLILTSPPYNTNKKAGKTRVIGNTKLKGDAYTYVRYDAFVDDFTDDEYTDFTKRLFLGFDKLLKPNGCVLYNINYGAENTDGMFKAINAVLTETPFTIADVIVWKKSSSFPNSTSSNRLTRIWEFIFVFCRKTEMKTFHCNKRVTSYRKTGQAAFENVFNLIEARNNDGSNPYNKATFSSELVEKLLALYAPSDGTVYDPFMGTGTTAVGCVNMGLSCIGTELSEKQCEFARERVAKAQSDWLDRVLGDSI